jgi:hypothetical protein
MSDISTMLATGLSKGPTKGRVACSLALIIVTAGCTGPAPQNHPTADASSPVTFDVRYEGSMRVSGAAMGVTAQDCDTPARISIEVRNNQFTLTQPPPNAVASTPSLRDRATRAYSATIRPDGAIAGTSNTSSATMNGRATGTRLSGQIHGLLCDYEFSADRI